MKKYLIIGLIILLSIIPSTMAAQISVGDGSFAVASGDMLHLTGYANGSDTAWMWMFTFQEDTSIIGAPIEIDGDNFKTNVVNITKLPEGKYMMVVEFGGKNDRQEVLYGYNNDTFRYEFTSPWRAPKTMKADDNPYIRIRQVEEYCNINKQYCDDTFYATNVTVEKPFIKFTDMYQYTYSDIYQGKSDIKDITKSGLLYLGGQTNLDPTHVITIVLDHNQTVKAVTEQPDPYGYYKWSAFLDISKLRTGSHPINIISDRTDEITTYLEIGLTPVTTIPTPPPMKVVRNEFISAPGNTVEGPSSEITSKATIAPNQFVSVVTPTEIPTVIPTTLDNAPLSNPDIGDKIVPEPTKSNKIPIDPRLGIIAICLVITYIHKKRNERV